MMIEGCGVKALLYLQPPRQPHTHLRRHRPKFIMNVSVKFQQHDAIYDRANRHRNQCEPDAGGRHCQTADANEDTSRHNKVYLLLVQIRSL